MLFTFTLQMVLGIVYVLYKKATDDASKKFI